MVSGDINVSSTCHTVLGGRKIQTGSIKGLSEIRGNLSWANYARSKAGEDSGDETGVPGKLLPDKRP